MKIKLYIAAMLTAAVFALSLMPLEAKAQKKESAQEQSKAQLKERATKTAKKETKKLEKEGWMVTPGALPIEKQLDRSYMLQFELDDNLTPKYIMSEAMSIGENYDGAKIQANELAKQSLAGQIATQMSTIIESSVSNRQLNNNQAATITETVAASINTITQKLGRSLPVVEMYRTIENGNKEVLVRIAYSTEAAMEITKSVIKEELSKQNNELHEQLDNALAF